MDKRIGTWENPETAVNAFKDKPKKKNDYDIPGVTKVVITPIIQKAIGCVVGQDVTTDDPCVYVKKETLEGNILQNEKSVFLPVKQEIIEYPEKDMLLVLDTKTPKSAQNFFVCVTTEAKDSILNVIEKEKDQRLLQLKRRIEKLARKWKSLGSELDIDETPPYVRPLIEVESHFKWPRYTRRKKFKLRQVEDATDSYVELVPVRTPAPIIQRRKIDRAIQVRADTTSNEAQTNPRYPQNSWTQYKFECDVQEDAERDERIHTFVSGLMKEIDSNIKSLCRRKDHSEEKVNETAENDNEPLDPSDDRAYPFAVVLRLRVLQIVCGIAALVMGTVAIIEEKGKLNLGLGIPAGGATIIAAAASIHTSRGFEGYRPSTCMPGSPLRFLGPSVRIALPLTILWGIACSFQTALIVNVTLTLALPTQVIDPDLPETEVATLQGDMYVLAGIELGLAALTILAVGLVLRIDCKYDPD